MHLFIHSINGCAFTDMGIGTMGTEVYRSLTPRKDDLRSTTIRQDYEPLIAISIALTNYPPQDTTYSDVIYFFANHRAPTMLPDVPLDTWVSAVTETCAAASLEAP